MFAPFMAVWNFFDGKKAYIAGTGLILISLGSLVTAVGHCIQDVPTIVNGWDICQQDVGIAWSALQDTLIGLGIIGVRHAVAKNA